MKTSSWHRWVRLTWKQNHLNSVLFEPQWQGKAHLIGTFPLRVNWISSVNELKDEKLTGYLQFGTSRIINYRRVAWNREITWLEGEPLQCSTLTQISSNKQQRPSLAMSFLLCRKTFTSSFSRIWFWYLEGASFYLLNARPLAKLDVLCVSE